MSILLIIIAVVSHIRIKRLKRVIIQLSEAEIQEFLEGVVLVQSSTSYDEACKTWESLPYNNMYEVPKTSLHFGIIVIIVIVYNRKRMQILILV